MTELNYLSAIESLRLFRARELSPVEVTQAIIERATQIEPQVHAFSETYFEEAMVAARRAEAVYSRGKSRPRARWHHCRHQGSDAGKRAAHNERFAGISLGTGREAKRSACRTTSSGRFNHSRAHDFARIHVRALYPFTALGGDAESLESELQPWRFDRRRGGCPGSRDDHVGKWHRHRRLHTNAGGVLRCSGIQAVLRTRASYAAV